MHPDVEKILLTENDIDRIITELADKINNDYVGQEILLVVILKGSLIFASDLMRKLNIPASIDFMKASSYSNSTVSSGTLNIKLDLETDIENKNVIIVEDIIDTGNTLFKLKDYLLKRNPKSLKICTLLNKPERRTCKIDGDYIGCVIPDEFVIGYGLDYAERYRNLPYVGILSRKIYE